MADGAGLSSVLERPGDDPGRAEEASPAPSIRYAAFISYSHRDERVAAWLHDKLERFVVPESLVGQETDQGPVPERLTPIFRDRGELAAADDLAEEIEFALSASKHLIVLCSPHAAKSRWTNKEIEAFRRLRPDGDILPAIVSGEPFACEMPGREADECFPAALRQHYDSSGKPTGQRAEPIAADFRRHGDGRRVGFLKIVAGMLGVGLDLLVQREVVRRQRRLAIVAAASLAGMAVTSGLAVVAVQSRDEARDQRREAEGLVGFMLGDLRGKLEPIGRLDALDAVGSKALDYFEKQDKGSLTDEALAQQSRALTLLGQIATSRGDLDGALRRYREAMAGTAEAVRRAPDNPQRLYDHAQNVFWVGDIARQRGNLDGAETASREYQRLAARMTALDPGNRTWRMEGLYAATNLGIVLVERGQYAEGAAEFRRALERLAGMTASDPRNIEYQKTHVELLAWLADASFGEGKLDEAIARREEQVALVERLMASGGIDVEYRQKAIPARRALGRILAARGQLRPALEQLQLAVRTGQLLIPAEPDNMIWVELTAGAELDLAAIQLAARQVGQASESTGAGCELVDRLIRRDASVGDWQRLAIDCLALRSRVALQSGRREEALDLAGRTLARAQSSRAGNAADRQGAMADSYRLLGDVQRRLGDVPAAHRAWNSALDALPASPLENPRQTAIRAELLRDLGRSAEARPLAERLKAIGYRDII